MKTILAAAASIAVLNGFWMSPAFAQMQPASGPAGVVDNPCPPPLDEPPELRRALQSPNPQAALGAPSPAILAFLKAREERAKNDWAGLCKYQADDAARGAAAAPTAVFLGDSITELWAGVDGDYFSAHRFVGRGISGQVTSQALLRFEQDVVALHPKVVHILIGTNDVAGNAGPISDRNIENNIMAMVALARANHIAVVLGTVPPAADFAWRRGLHPAQTIIRINDWIRSYARREHLVVADYHTVLRNPEGGFRSEWSPDGVHPNLTGFKQMEPVTDAAVKAALAAHP